MLKTRTSKAVRTLENKYLEILKKNWGFDSFRGIQEQIITSIGEGHDTLGLMPTGGGKSICFQVPALALDGICIVITPLIALMKDQVSNLRQKGIKAEAIYAGMSHDDILRVMDNCILGNYKFLYVSPERLASEIFLAKLQLMKHICMLTIDEAHCLSQWGYDFRPAYLQISKIRHIIPYHVPVLALTASATLKVVDDIQEKLEFSEKRVFRMSFDRKNIVYVVRETSNKDNELLHIIERVTEGSAIVYTRSRKQTEELANLLRENDISADSYHAGLTNAERDLKQRAWTEGLTRVMVATNAFGMGIDKPDVRIVIHYAMPNSMEAYYQEAGRAGRDGKRAYAVLLYEPYDKTKMLRRIPETFPDIDFIKEIYDDVCYYLEIGEGEGLGRTFDFSVKDFCVRFKHYPVNTESALHLLSNARYIDFQEEKDLQSRIQFIIRRDELYKLNDNDKEQDSLVRAILRTYTGVFADFVYIDETLLSSITGLSNNKIYNILKDLSRMRIIAFIPHKKTPTITFTRARIDSSLVALPPSVYKDRKAEFEKRMGYMLEYAESKVKCRSMMLLNYFGENADENCGHCDICIEKKKEPITSDEIDCMHQLIKESLKDGEFHKLSEIRDSLMSKVANKDILNLTLQLMSKEEEIENVYGEIRLKQS